EGAAVYHFHVVIDGAVRRYDLQTNGTVRHGAAVRQYAAVRTDDATRTGPFRHAGYDKQEAGATRTRLHADRDDARTNLLCYLCNNFTLAQYDFLAGFV